MSTTITRSVASCGRHRARTCSVWITRSIPIMFATAMNTYHVVELLGDGISPELSRSVHALAAVLPCRIEFTQVDLSEQKRSARGPALYDEAVALMKRHQLALKYPT